MDRAEQLTAVTRIAAAYPPEAAHTPAVERERHFTRTQQLAWDIRFGGLAMLARGVEN